MTESQCSSHDHYGTTNRSQKFLRERNRIKSMKPSGFAIAVVLVGLAAVEAKTLRTDFVVSEIVV